MRFTSLLTTILSEDDSQIEQLLDQKLKLDDVAVTTLSSGTRVLAVSAANIALPLGGVTAGKYLLLVAYDAVQVRINDIAAPLLNLTPIPAATTTIISNVQKSVQPARLFIGPSNISAVYLTNPSGTATARVFAALIGEP